MLFFGVSEGDGLIFRDNYIPVKATIPKECGEDKYKIKCEFNEREQLVDPLDNYLVGPGEIKAYIDFYNEFYFLDKVNQDIKIELVNTTKERVEDVKELDVKILSPGIRHKLNIKVRTEISYDEEIVVEEDNFYAKDIPEDDRNLLLESVEVTPIRQEYGSDFSEYFFIDTLFGENSFNKGSNIGLTITMRKEDEVINSDYYVICGFSRDFHYRLIREPGDYTIELEFKNNTIENSESIKKTFNFTIDYKLIENLRLELDKEEVAPVDEVEIVAFSDDDNDESCEYSFYSRKKGTESYTLIIERTESSVARFKPSEVGEYEFKVIAHGSLKDHVFEGANLIVNNAKEDTNKDREVTILDLSIIANKYNSKKGEDSWNEYYDLNNDDIIDIYDLVIVAKEI